MPVLLFLLVLFSSSGGYLNLQRSSSSALTGSSAVGCCVTRHWTFNKTWIEMTLLFSTNWDKNTTERWLLQERQKTQWEKKWKQSSVQWKCDKETTDWEVFVSVNYFGAFFRLCSCRYTVCHIVCVLKKRVLISCYFLNLSFFCGPEEPPLY